MACHVFLSETLRLRRPALQKAPHTNRVACHVLLPEASASQGLSQGASRGSLVMSCCQWPTSLALTLRDPMHACTLLPSRVANGQRNLAPDTAKSIPAHTALPRLNPYRTGALDHGVAPLHRRQRPSSFRCQRPTEFSRCHGRIHTALLSPVAM